MKRLRIQLDYLNRAKHVKDMNIPGCLVGATTRRGRLGYAATTSTSLRKDQSDSSQESSLKYISKSIHRRIFPSVVRFFRSAKCLCPSCCPPHRRCEQIKPPNLFRKEQLRTNECYSSGMRRVRAQTRGTTV